MNTEITVVVQNVEMEIVREVQAVMTHWDRDYIDIVSPIANAPVRFFRVYSDPMTPVQKPIYVFRHSGLSYSVHLTPEQEAIGATW